MSGNSTGGRRRVVMAIAALVLAADASALVAHEVRGTSARSDQAASPSARRVTPEPPPRRYRTPSPSIGRPPVLRHASGITNTTGTVHQLVGLL